MFFAYYSTGKPNKMLAGVATTNSLRVRENRKDLMEIIEVGTRDRVIYFTTRPLALFLLIKINEQTLNQTANQIGWFSTIILGFACLYLGWFSVISIPGVFYYWITDDKPPYIPPPREKTPPEP